MTPTPPLSLQLRADENFVVIDFADFDGGRLRGREKHALHGALDDAIRSLNLRLVPAIRPGRALTR